MRARAVPPLLLLVWLLALLSACATGPRSVEIPLAQLQAALERRFPQVPRLGGLAVLEVGVPRLQLLPGQNRLRVDFSVASSGRIAPRPPRGELGLSFGLRYEPGAATIRAADVRLEQIDVQGVPQEVRGFLRTAGALVAEQLLDGAVLHTLRPEDVARAGGWMPGAIRVTPTGVRVELLPPVVRAAPISSGS